MFNKNINYKDKSDLDSFIQRRASDIQSAENVLIQVFCGKPDTQFINNLLDELRDSFPNACIIGTTTAGEILEGESLDQTTIISVTGFQTTTVSSSLLTENENLLSGGASLTSAQPQETVKLAIVFGCGIKDGGAINGEPLLEGIQKSYPEAIVVGGQAGDNGLAKNTFVFTEEGVTDKGVAVCFLSGDSLVIDNRYNLSWKPLGRAMSITRASGTRIETIDGRPAKEVYSHYLGDNVGERLPHSAAEFPLVVERHGVMLARHANRVLEDGSLDFMAPFYTGETVQFAFCHSDLVVESAKQMYEELKSNSPEAIFIYSCLSRKWVLGSDIKLELSPLASLAPTSGFFSYGEYFSNNGKAMFLSQTMTVLGLSERNDELSANESVAQSYDFQQNETKQLHDLQALHHLVETFADEQEKLISELQRALAEIKTLQGFIPICAKCKNIKDDKGYWTRIEKYISENTEAQFSHSLCPGCVEDLYPEIYEELKQEGKIQPLLRKNN